MSVGAAIRITSPNEARVIEHAVEYAKQQGSRCYVFSVVTSLPFGAVTNGEREAVRMNLKLIESLGAAPVMQEGKEIANTLIAAARYFEIRTLFVQSGGSKRMGRSVAERLLNLDPPFDVVVIGSE